MRGTPRVRAAVRLRRMGCAVAAICTLLGPTVLAQGGTNDNTPANRWLLVVDTARSMESRADAVQQIGAALVLSGMNGQMRRGDTLGVWTFDQTMVAGRFPLQEWTPERSQTIARRLVEFLRTLKYNKESRLETVLPDMYRVIKGSDFITVILLSDGSSQIKGTPFDDKINTSYHTWQKEQAKSEMPFVTLLRAAHGKITHYVVNMPPFPLDLPPMSPELLAARTPPPKPPAQPPPVGEPLIISGKKPETTATQTETQAVSTALSQNAGPPSSTGSELIVAARPLTNSAQSVEPVEILAPAQPEAQMTPVPRSTPATASADDSAAPSPEPAVMERPAPPPRAVLPAQQATAIAQEPLWHQKPIWIGAGVFLLLLVTLAIRSRRRSRTEPRISLITRSLDRDEK